MFKKIVTKLVSYDILTIRVTIIGINSQVESCKLTM